MKLSLKLLVLINCFLLIGTITGQSFDFDNYRPLKSTGELPSEFSKTFDFKKKVPKSTYKTPREREDVVSSEYLDDLLHSGDVLFNDPISEYLNKIMSVILESNGITNDVRVYLLKTDEANAFAFHKNVILVTMGLMAQVSSEAELAIVLCHEYVHYRDKHLEIELKETLRIEKEERRTKRLTQNETDYLLSRYSQDLELKADAGGLDLFVNTPYNVEAASTHFDVLRFSNLPFEEEEFALSFLESTYLKIDKKYYLKEVAPIEINPEKEKEDSKYSTHPDIETMRTAMLSKLDGMNATGKADFIVSETDFYLYRKVCRYEVCRLQLLYQDYANAFYSGFLLLKENPNSVYLKRTVVRALYGLSTYSNANKLSKVILPTKRIAGNSQRVFYLFHELKRRDLNFISLNYAWRAHMQFPEDEDIKVVCDELIMMAVNKHALAPFYFKTAPPDTIKTTSNSDSTVVDTSSNVNDKKNNKYTKIKTVVVNTDNKGNKTTKKESFDYLQYAFIDIADNVEFKERIKYFYERKKEEEDEDVKDLKKKKKEVKTLDNTRPQISDVVFVEPQKTLVDTRPKAKKTYTYISDVDKAYMYSSIDKIASKVGVKDNIVDRYSIGESQVDELNEFGLMMDFISEQSNHQNKIVMLPTDYVELKNIQEKYGTPYIGLIGVVCFKNESSFKKVVTNLVLPVLYWVALPYGIIRIAQPDFTTYVFAEIYDLEIGKKVYSGLEEYDFRATNDVVSMALYDIMEKIRNKK